MVGIGVLLAVLIIVPPLMGVLDKLVATVGGNWVVVADFLCMNHNIKRTTTTTHTTIMMVRWVLGLKSIAVILYCVLFYFLYIVSQYFTGITEEFRVHDPESTTRNTAESIHNIPDSDTKMVQIL